MATAQRASASQSVDSVPAQSSPTLPYVRETPIAPPPWTVFHHGTKLAYWLSSILAVVATVASAIGVFHPSLFRDTAMTTGNAQGTDLVILVVAVPTLVISMLLTARGSLRAPILWLGALCYVLYNAVFFAFDVAFNQMFFLYVAVLSLTAWSLVALLMSIDAARVRACITDQLPVRTIAAYLLVTTGLFAATWLRDIVPALANLTVPGSLQGTLMLTNPIQVIDFAFWFPLTVLAAVWLWRRRPWGHVLAGMFLVYGVIEALSVASDQTFGHLNDPAQSAAMVPVFGVLALIALVPLLLFLHAVRRWPLDRAA
jgi:hypothetical protein